MIKHIAFVMDGNRRWAKANGIKVLYGDKSQESIQLVLSYCLKNHIQYLSLYAFSLENFKRSPEETAYVCQAAVETIKKSLPEFIKQEIQLRFIGERSLFPDTVLEAIITAEEATQSF